jgi:predicted Rossmann-fold nucleotide-binding protein
MVTDYKKRTKRVIAVFGGLTAPAVLKSAEELGHVVAAEGQILLTGGTRCAEDSVKNAAICGAGSSPWVGVEREAPVRAERQNDSKQGFVIFSDLNHKRNYLEACLCDAAIALEGGSGTLSEVTCALSLGRPVALVGAGWREQYDLDDAGNRSTILDGMVSRTLERFEHSQGLEALLTKDALRAGLNHLPSFGYFELGAEGDAVAWIESVLPEGRSLPGTFPQIEGHQGVAREYEAWLGEVAR